MSAGSATGLELVRRLYDDLKADQAAIDTAPPAADHALIASVGSLLAAEARLLDSRQFQTWLSLWEDDGFFWVPLDADTHPGDDQSFFLDDRRRLGERVWRMTDKTAWGIWPPPRLTRLVSGVEAWRDQGHAEEAPNEVLAASAVLLHYVRRDHVWQTAGRQIHRLRQTSDGWRICRKILVLPVLEAGAPNLGWLL